MAETPESAERITEAELAVMEALWLRSPLSANEVADEVAPARGWSLATVKTLLSRLAAKQAVHTQPQGKRFLYSPGIAREAWLGGESRRMVDRLFGGSAAGLFAHLAESEALSPADLDRIEALLKELRK
ncbi:MAG: BlaI/MecI/CopY family transcriptional regulator [Novosphingobium sp.]|uniref:BlaI/MecI/CopY family transcriptional regulator n=1 Tax=Novosphingobium sp. TaxID=1874826 RepID=UPI002633E9F7|nr:BlaI/MecI/CopY family transcriptional regulator [Novosphingobium sp.]MCP5386671.1 BlaI/MecI/CopY family transcriptional regulator [Novosphingobium sp.]HNN56401.1 BlaI/MecI/CopY family transcriptional regulator [Novosphingobium sp.]